MPAPVFTDLRVMSFNVIIIIITDLYKRKGICKIYSHVIIVY
jgi:hypothetical protein